MDGVGVCEVKMCTKCALSRGHPLRVLPRDGIKMRGVKGYFFLRTLVEQPEAVRVAGVVSVELEVEAIEELHRNREVLSEEGVDLDVGV